MTLKPTKQHELYKVALDDSHNMPVVSYGSAGTRKIEQWEAR